MTSDQRTTLTKTDVIRIASKAIRALYEIERTLQAVGPGS